MLDERRDGTVRVASYNVRKAIGLDRRRDPARTLAVIEEIDADIVALQEADRRFGPRHSAIPVPLIDASRYRPVDFDIRPQSIGWHGNALLIKSHVEIVRQMALEIPTLEPRGAVFAELALGNARLVVIGMHLDLSGLWRRKQARAILDILEREAAGRPRILMGDLNEWSMGGCLKDFGAEHHVLRPGRSFHAKKPVGELDRVILSRDIDCAGCGVHMSEAARIASDHLPVWADLVLPA